MVFAQIIQTSRMIKTNANFSKSYGLALYLNFYFESFLQKKKYFYRNNLINNIPLSLKYQRS